MESHRHTAAIVVTAADATFFPMCLGWILSIRVATAPNVPDLGILDLGLTARQRLVLEGLGAVLRTPDWDCELPGRLEDYPAYFKAMTARPHLPKYFPNREVLVWVDSDAWVQDFRSIEKLIEVARGDRLAIVRERFNEGAGVAFPIQTAEGIKQYRYTVESITKNVTKCYENAFGADTALTLGQEPSYNSGVFALKRDSAYWSVWNEWLKIGLKGGFHHLVEQQALNVAIHRGEIDIEALPWQHNFICIHALPEIDKDRDKLVTPGADSEVIGVVHLTGAKQAPHVPLRVQQTGRVTNASLHYLAWISARPRS